MITLDKISKSFGSKVLFEDVSITFIPGERYGLTGPNGAGKSTLMKIFSKEETPLTGHITVPKRLGVLKQSIEQFRDNKVLDVVIMGNMRLWEAMLEREHLYAMDVTDEIGLRLGELEEVIADEDGYSAESKAEILLEGVGIDPHFFQAPMATLPADDQFKVLLCQALFGGAQALLLDEPTNHLDLDSIRWLEEFLMTYKGVLIVVSHDRHFLNTVCTKIADIDYETIIEYPGNYDEMVLAKTQTQKRAENDAKSKEKKIAQLKEFVARFSAGTRASQVQSRMKEMKRLEPAELKKSNISRPYIRFPTPQKESGKVAFRIEGLSKSFGDLQVFSNFDLEILRGEKVGIIGNNGAGKTTLVRILVSALAPDCGTIDRGHELRLSYFPQNHHERIDKTKEKRNLFEWLKDSKEGGAYDLEVRSVLGKMLFAGDDAFKKVCDLSGGETARLLLAQMMMSDHNCIVLDEPNNHLDLEAVSALGWGLEDYKGTVLCVSHNRDLLESCCTKIIAFDHGRLTVFNGPLSEYLSSKK